MFNTYALYDCFTACHTSCSNCVGPLVRDCTKCASKHFRDGATCKRKQLDTSVINLFLAGFYIENRLIKDTFYSKNKSDLVLIPVLILGLSSNNGCIKLEYCDLAIFYPLVIWDKITTESQSFYDMSGCNIGAGNNFFITLHFIADKSLLSRFWFAFCFVYY